MVIPGIGYHPGGGGGTGVPELDTGMVRMSRFSPVNEQIQVK